MSDQRDDLTGLRDILAAHFVMWHQLPLPARGEWRCACGKKFGFSDSAIDHQVQELAADREQYAQQRAAEDLAGSIEGVLVESCHHCGRLPDDAGGHSCRCPLGDSECIEHTAEPVVSRLAIRAALTAEAQP